MSFGLYLDHRLVLPGDILLELGTSAQSRAIALATKSDFSHASILVAGLVALEALDDGVLRTDLEYCAVELPGGEVRAAVDLGGAAKAVMVRHSALERQRAADKFEVAGATNRYDVADAIMERLEQVIGSAYATTAQLLCAATPGSPLHALGMWLGARSSGGQLPVEERGIFCSELVARAYEEIGLPLFDEPKPVGQVSPGDLARSPFLQIVEGAVFSAKPTVPDSELKQLMDEWNNQRASRENQAKFYRTLNAAKKL